jgi:hypothetical protein
VKGTPAEISNLRYSSIETFEEGAHCDDAALKSVIAPQIPCSLSRYM